jgi:hypothetical protein
LAGGAARREPVSPSQNPSSRGKYREVARIRAPPAWPSRLIRGPAWGLARRVPQRREQEIAGRRSPDPRGRDPPRKVSDRRGAGPIPSTQARLLMGPRDQRRSSGPAQPFPRSVLLASLAQ